MNLHQFKIFFNFIIFFIKLIILLLFLLWAIDTHQYLKNNHFFELITKYQNFQQIISTSEPHLIFLGKSLAVLTIKIMFIMFISYLFRNFPTPISWIKKWDDENDIDNILGKNIANHFRNKKNISFEGFLNLENYSKAKKKLLIVQASNPLKKSFMEKYDPYLEEDLS